MKNDMILERAGISVDEFLTFANGIPNHMMVRQFPDGTRDTFQLGRFVQEISNLDRKLILYTPNFQCILTRIHKSSGQLCLQYSCAFAFLEQQILTSEPLVASCSEAHRAMTILREIESILEIGTTREQYAAEMSARWLFIKDFVEQYSSRFPLYCQTVSGTYKNYSVALDIWRQGAGQFPMQFIGGGFGVVGAATGMAVSFGLNTLAGLFNKSKDSGLQQRLIAEWKVASRKIAVLRMTTATPTQ